MALLPGKTISHFFYVRSLSNRILIPDANPTAVLIRGIIDTTVAVSVSATADGGWVAQATLPSDWQAGDMVSLRISAIKDAYSMSNTVPLGSVDADDSTKLAAIALTAQDLSDLRGFTAGHPMTADAATGVITANGKTVTVTEDGTTQTYTRS